MTTFKLNNSLLLAIPKSISTLIWDSNGALPLSDGGGSWNATGGTNWYDGTIFGSWINGSIASFGVASGAAGTINVGSVVVDSILFAQTGSGFYTLSGGNIEIKNLTINVIGINGALINSVLSGTKGLKKLGSFALSLTGSNTYTGNTTISRGTLQLGSGNNNTGTLNPSSNIVLDGGSLCSLAINKNNTNSQGTNFGTITGLGNFIQSGTGTTYLIGNNSYIGTTLISGGILTLGNITGTVSGRISPIGSIINNGILSIRCVDSDMVQGADFCNSPIFGNGSLSVSGSNNLILNEPNHFTNTASFSGTGKIILSHPLALHKALIQTQLSSGSSGAFDISSIGTTLRVGGVYSSTSLSIAFIGYNNISTLILNPQSGRSPNYSAVIANGSSGGTHLIKDGAGTQVLSSQNTYTGSTTISNGTLTINRSTGSLPANTSVIFDNSGGNLSFNNVGASSILSYTINSLSLLNGDASLTSIRTAAFDQYYAINSYTTSLGPTLNFVVGGTPSTSNGFIFPSFIGTRSVYFFNGGSTSATYAYRDSLGFVRAINYGVDPNTATTTGGTSLPSGNDVQTTGSITAQGSASFDTIRIQNTANSAQSLTISSGSTLQTNGILRAGNGGSNSTTTISGGSIQSQGAWPMIIRCDMTNDLLSISSPISTTGYPLVKSGSGTLILSGNNTNSTGTILNNGTLRLQGSTTMLGTGPLTINGGTLIVDNGAFNQNNNIIANSDFNFSNTNFASGNIANLGTGYFRIKQPITITGGNDNSGADSNGLTISNTISDINGNNTLNAFDILWDFANRTTNGITLSANILLRDHQRLNVINLNQSTSNFNISGNISDGGNNYGLTFTNNSAPSPLLSTITYARGPGVFLTGNNTYTGNTTIDPGAVVTIGRGGTTGSLSSSSSIVNNGVLGFWRNNTITQGSDFGTISGAGQVVKFGIGSLVYTSPNSYSGLTSIRQGFLVIQGSALISGPAKINTATISNFGGWVALVVDFNIAPISGETYKLLTGPTLQTTFNTISLTGTGVSGKSASYNSTNSTLTII